MIPRNGVVALAVAAACALGACNDAPTSVQRASRASNSQLDGTTSGNAHFYFLQPIAPVQPSFSGEFNPDVFPTVEICQGTSQRADGHCEALWASFTRIGGEGNQGELISIPPGEELYAVDWRTASFLLPYDYPLRVVVMLGDFQAGYIDVIRNATGFRNAETNTLITGTGTLPIRFRIERGVICGEEAGCAETLVTPTGGTFTIGEEGERIAGVQFPPNALSQPVNLIIEEVSGEECLPTDVQQFSQCYHYSTEPVVGNFNLPVTVGFCMTDPSALQYLSDGELRLWKWNEVQGSPLVELERVTVDFLDCPDLSGLSYRSAPAWLRGLARVGSTVMAPVAKLVGPKELHAIGSEGGKLINFSRIGWVRPLDVEVIQGNKQTGMTGSPLPVKPTVRVKNRYGVASQGVAGRRVEFTPSTDGSAAPATALSDANGLAQTAWTLASAAGANTLRARARTSRAKAPAPYQAQRTLSATGVVEIINIKWQPPLGTKSTSTPANLSGLAPITTISVVGGGTVTVLNMVEGSGQYSTSWSIPALDANATYKVAVSSGGVERGAVLLQAVDGLLRNVTTGEKVLNLKNSRTLPIKAILYH